MEQMLSSLLAMIILRNLDYSLSQSDISGDDVVVTAAPLVADTTIRFYRIRLADDQSTASISEGPQVSTEETPMLDLTVNQVSATAVVQASATSGGSTTVNAYRIHIPVPAGTQFTEIDSFAHANTQGALYVAVTHQTDNKSAIDEIMVVTDGTDAYNT